MDKYDLLRSLAIIHSLARDAARYRWLRNRGLDTIDEGGVFAGMTPDNVVLNGEDLDQAVDHARQAEKTTV